MDAEDLNRRVIGLLTLAYNALHELEAGETDEGFRQEFGRAVDSLMEGWGSSYNVDVDLPPTQGAAVRAALQQLGSEISGDLITVFGIFTGVFARLCQEIEDKYPEADIAGMLQEIGLKAAEGE